MQIRKDDNSGAYTINSYQPGTLVINHIEYHHSVILSRTQLITDWAPKDITELSAEHFAAVIQLKPEVILLGTGIKLVFPDHRILAPVYNQHIGIEIMDSHAACRTFKVLVSEDRHVVAAIIV